MNCKASVTGMLAAGVVYLLGCSTPARPPTVRDAPPRVVMPLDVPPLDQPQDPVLGRICQLGTSCLELDPRPFEMCLLATNKHCGEKITESLLAVNPEPSEPR
jgi:hypothetical protein